MDEEELLLSLFVLLPFATVYKWKPNTTSFVTWLELIALIKLFIGNKIKLTKSFLGYYCLFSMCIILSMMIAGNGFRVSEIIKNIVGLLLVYHFAQICSEKGYERIIYYYFLGMIISSIIALMGEYFRYFTVFVRQIGYDIRIQNRFSGLNGDPNYYSVCLIMVLLGAYSLRKVNRQFFYIALAMVTILGMQTYSKSFFLVLIVTYIFIMYEDLNNHEYLACCLYILCAAIGLWMISRGRIDVINLIIYRFKDSANAGGITTGRADIWGMYVQFFLTHPVQFCLGVGLNSGFLDGQGPHNFYIELLYFLGLIGTLPFLGCIMAIVGGIKTRKRTLANYFGVIVMVMWFFLQMLFNNELYFQILYLVLIYKFGFVAKGVPEHTSSLDNCI